MDDLLFSLFFAGFAADVYRHGPIKHGLVRGFALSISFAAILFSRFEGFVLAELVWLLALAASIVLNCKEEREDKDAAARKKASPRSLGPPPLPKTGHEEVEESMKQLIGNLDDKLSCDGKPWKLQQDKDGIQVYCADFPGKSTKRWKAVCIIRGATLEEIEEEVFNFDNRSGQYGWDTAIKEGKILITFKEGKHVLSRMVTNAVAGGAISSREFFDLRWQLHENDHPEAPKGGMIATMVGLNPKHDKKWLPKLPNADSRFVLGQSYQGGGIKLTPIGEKEFKYEIVNNVDLGGWIPTSVINTATSSAILESHQAMLQHLTKKFA